MERILIGMMLFIQKKLRERYFVLLPIAVILYIMNLSGFYLETYGNEIIIKETIIPIVTYHKFCNGASPDEYTINIDLFKQHLDYLKQNHYQVISVAQLLQCIKNNDFPDKTIVITIDDGFKSIYTLAFPLLKEYQFPATLFLYTDFIGNHANQLSWQEIREMMEDEMEIGSHTISHCNLLHMNQNESQMGYFKRINEEISLSKNILEKNTDRKVVSFAYPYGVYSQEIQMLSKQAGYQALLNVNGMNNTTYSIDNFSLNRQVIPANFSTKKLDALLHEQVLHVNTTYPNDGTVTNNQELKIGAILDDSSIISDTINFKLSGSNLLNYTYINQLKEISFIPTAPKLLQKRSWIAQITALDKESGYNRKVSWLFTIK